MPTTSAASATTTTPPAATTIPLTLTPSQTIRSSSHPNNKNNNNNNGNDNNQKKKQNNRNKNTKHTNHTKRRQKPSPNNESENANATTVTDTATPPLPSSNLPQGSSSSSSSPATATATKKKPRNNNNNRNKKNGRPNKASSEQQQQQQEQQPSDEDHRPTMKQLGNNTNNNTNTKKKNQRRSRRGNKNKKHNNDLQRYPWRAYIPEGSVDPITLDPLDQLPYPPFALAAHEPYDPIPEWPIPADEDDENENDTNDNEETEEARQRRILQEQWGKAVSFPTTSGDSDANGQNDAAANDAVSQVTTTTNTNKQPPPERQTKQKKNRHVNLYDGRALAYYVTSQLQFIDPLNRRDLTRDELLNLDAYLQRHHHPRGKRGSSLHVTEAYDAKGVTLSTAGAAAHTAAGRAQILQQEAAVLLQALFGGHSVSAVRSSSNRRDDNNSSQNNRLAQQYQAHEALQQQSQISTTTTRRRRNNEYADNDNDDDIGIYGDAQGILVIDDDLNPGLRGDAAVFVPDAATTATNGSLSWSASHIAAQYGHAARLQAHEFPSLADVAAPSSASGAGTASTTATSREERPKPKAKTLSKITGVVKQTTEEERQRQWEAREAMKRKAALSNLTFGATTTRVNLTNGASATTTLLQPPSSSAAASGPTEAQVERNRALADALGVVPSTLRQTTIYSGWARPTDPVKEFGEELQRTIYPDALLIQARERMPLVLKMEKRWNTFLPDDTSASLPLPAMDRGNRTLVHQYAEFWGLATESFDPEPRRYIHCTKTRHTCAPYPLLSTAARQWTGPQYASQPPPPQQPQVNSRFVPETNHRPPLPLKPPSASTAMGSRTATSAVASTLSGARLLLTQEGEEEAKANHRFDVLASERPKLQLQPRTVPLDMPAAAADAQASPTLDMDEQLRLAQVRREEKARQEQAAQEAKRKALEAAFASDSEDDDDDDNGIRKAYGDNANADSDNEWVEQEPLYQGDDDDE